MTIKSIILAAVILMSSTSVNAVTLTFDDVAGGSIQNSNSSMPTYQGFDFNPTLYWMDVVGSVWNYGAHSDDFALLNNLGGAGIITETNNADFTFDGLWAKKWFTAIDSGGEDTLFGTMSGYNNGIQVWKVSTGLNGSYKYFGAQAGAIDELILDFGNHFLVDDIVLNEMSAVPVPAAAWLFGSGLIGLVGISRRNTRVQS